MVFNMFRMFVYPSMQIRIPPDLISIIYHISTLFSSSSVFKGVSVVIVVMVWAFFLKSFSSLKGVTVFSKTAEKAAVLGSKLFNNKDKSGRLLVMPVSGGD